MDMPELTPPPSGPPPENIVISNPPPGKKKIAKIYWDPDTQEYVFDHEE